MNPIELFKKFIITETPSFKMLFNGKYTFCFQKQCSDCKVKKECIKGNARYLTTEEYLEIKDIYPELFI